MTDKNATSFTDLVKTYSSQLLRFIKGRVKKTEDAEDIMQDVWYQFSRLTNIDELENVGAWLYSVTRNKITDSYRKKRDEPFGDLYSESDDEVLPIRQLLVADDTNNPELKLFKDIFWDELMKALDELPEKQRRVFILNELEDHTLQEIADMDNEKLKTIISRKGYAVKHLRVRLRSLYEDLK
ncbi:RNA polymerase sigma factor [Sphingobacterium suaedae]|uniref:RNA polymerase sigma factor n=1 Tax=Sphingobacterium suaedae TaxID=1686402 RepID=A0ABW5KBX3_9SPHI